MHGNKVLLYELNEVPWQVLDLYTAARPGSALGSVVGSGRCLTTVNDDPVHLQPWRTWPTFHTSLYTDDHGSFDLGQDPASFRGTPIWDVVDEASRPVGLFGVLQSWPPREFRAGGFFVPDTFARSPETCPPSLERFQAFNLAMTRENGFASDSTPRVGELARAGVDLAVHGLTARSAGELGSQLLHERRDRRFTARRSVAQALPSFDLFWRLHQRHRPHLSIFFTNHVAGMMHRFWGDAVPDYPDADSYPPDPVYSRFLFDALDVADRQLARVLRFLRRDPDTVLLIASSMGQGPIPYRSMPKTWVIEDPGRLASGLGLRDAEPLLAMYPRLTYSVLDEAVAADAAARLGSVRTSLGPLFTDVRVVGTTVSFEVDYRFDAVDLPTTAELAPGGPEVQLADLGIVARARPGGGNTAFHTREGILVGVGGGQRPDGGRRQVSVLDAAPSILELLGLDAAPGMQGQAGLLT